MSNANTMGKKREKTVYITRDTGLAHAEIWDTKIGICMRQGCVQFVSGAKVTKSGKDFAKRPSTVGRIDGYLAKEDCREQYGSYPAKGAAYLVEDRGDYWLWTRIEHNLHLLDWYGNIIPRN